MEIPSWLVIGLVTLVVSAASGFLSKQDRRWFKHLRRPKWLTFEKLIPLIWTIVFICGAWSAYIVWEADPGTTRTWLLMAFYVLVEIAIVSYTPVMCKTRSLKVGTIIGGVGFVLGLILALIVLSIRSWAFILLLPYLLWSPIGTFVTWEMAKLNPADS